MNFNIHPEASDEVDDAYSWYENQQSGLGQRFVSEVMISVNRIQYFPHLGRLIYKDMRRVVVPSFPYGIMYSIENETIEIHSIANLHRKPFYWKERKSAG